MSEEYDVDTKLTLNDKPARDALLRIANDFEDLYTHSLRLGKAIRAAMAVMRPEAKAFATTIGIAGARMNALAMSTYKVKNATAPLASALEKANSASIKLGSNGKRAGDQLASGLQRASSAGNGLGSVFRSALGFAAAYVGVNALSSAFRSLVSESLQFNDVTEKNRISLGAILAASDMFKGVDPAEKMIKSGALGDAVFRQLQADALASVATSQELASIYTGISGPLLGAGARLSEIRQITKDTATAATVLGVDFEQAGRDIMQMSTGTAGMDTKLFKMLVSTKAIKLSTEQWNATLPYKRVLLMKEALEKFGPAGEAYAKTLPGVRSAIKDFKERFRAAFLQGPFQMVRSTLERLVGLFNRNQTRIFAVLGVLGNRLAAVFDPVIGAAERAGIYFLENWEEIARRIETGWQKLQHFGQIAAHYAPTAMAGAKAAGGVALLGKFAPGAAGGAYSAVKAGMGGGAAAGAGTIATTIAEVTHLVGVIAAMGGTFTILLPLAAVIVGLFALLADNWTHVVPVLGLVWSFIQTIFMGLWGLVSSVFGALMPLLKIVGVLVGSVLAFGAIILSVFGRLALAVFGGVMSVLSTIFDYLAKGFNWVYDQIVGVFTGLLDFFGQLHKDLLPRGGTASGGGFLADLRRQFDASMGAFQTQEATDKAAIDAAENGAPGTRKTTINDFRGSRIEVKQDFRNANPDNVWLQMLDGVNSAADQRLVSALAPDFAR